MKTLINFSKVLTCIVCIAFFGVCFTTNVQSQTNKHSKTTMYPTYKGLIMAGYQGWFRAPEDGIMYPDDSRIRIDMWPDVSEYEKTYPTGLKHADGSVARFFSTTDRSTVDVQFRWMQEYGLDGVFMQRFFGDARPNNPQTTLLKNAFELASQYKRAIGVMYDLSGLGRANDDCSRLIEDWKYLVDSLKVTNQKGSQTYIFFNGKPLVTIWGLGFPDRPYNIRNIGISKFIEFLKNVQEEFEVNMTLDMGQWLSIPFVLLGIYCIWRALTKYKLQGTSDKKQVTRNK